MARGIKKIVDTVSETAKATAAKVEGEVEKIGEEFIGLSERTIQEMKCGATKLIDRAKHLVDVVEQKAEELLGMEPAPGASPEAAPLPPAIVLQNDAPPAAPPATDEAPPAAT